MTDFTANRNLAATSYEVDATKVAEAIMSKLRLVRCGREALTQDQVRQNRDAEERDR